MKRFHYFLIAVAALPLPAFCQKLSPQEEMDKALAGVDKQLTNFDKQLQSMDGFLAQADVHIRPNFFAVPDFGYDGGMRALDNHKYDAAVASFERVVAAKSSRSEGALYWKAYALNRLGRRDDALAAIAELRRDYPKSRWLNDAQALEVEVRQGSGKPVSPAEESNEDLKLIAINGLLSADPNKAVPLLESLLKGTATPPVKDRAMFVLAQSPSPRAQQLLADYAKGSGNPDLQVRAVRYLGIAGSQERVQTLVGVYTATADASVKRAAIQALFIANAGDKLADLARKERDPDLKRTIVQQLSVMTGNKEAMDYMMELLK